MRAAERARKQHAAEEKTAKSKPKAPDLSGFRLPETPPTMTVAVPVAVISYGRMAVPEPSGDQTPPQPTVQPEPDPQPSVVGIVIPNVRQTAIEDEMIVSTEKPSPPVPLSTFVERLGREKFATAGVVNRARELAIRDFSEWVETNPAKDLIHTRFPESVAVRKTIVTDCLRAAYVAGYLAAKGLVE